MTCVFFDTNALYIEGYRDSFTAGSLTYDLVGTSQVGVRVLHGTDYLALDAWSGFTRQDGSGFSGVNDLTAYLAGEFAKRRSIGGLSVLTAGADIGGHKALMFAVDGSAVYADPFDDDYVFAGVSLNAGSAGGTVQAMSDGLIVEPSWSWTPLQPVYVASAGVLTQTPPTAGFFHFIGRATSATSLMVAPEPLVVLA